MAVILKGYATLFNVPVTVQGDETEIIQQGAFAHVLDRPCRLFFDSHADDAPRLGETNLMFEDEFGLAFQAELDPAMGSMLAQIVSGKTALCSVCMTHRKYDAFDGVQIVTSANLVHIAVTGRAAYGDTAVWRADVSLDAAPWRIRECAERWEAGYAAHLASGTTKPIIAVTNKRAVASAEAVAREHDYQMKLKAFGGHPHHHVRLAPAPAPAEQDGEPSTMDMVVECVDEITDRLIQLEGTTLDTLRDRVGELEAKLSAVSEINKQRDLIPEIDALTGVTDGLRDRVGELEAKLSAVSLFKKQRDRIEDLEARLEELEHKNGG